MERKSSDGVCFMKYVYEVNGVATHKTTQKNHALFMEVSKWKGPEYVKGLSLKDQPRMHSH